MRRKQEVQQVTGWQSMRGVPCTVTILVLATLLGCFRQHQPTRVVKTMSVETDLYLIDAARLDQLSRAVESFLNDEDPAALDALLHESLSSQAFRALLRTDPVLADYFAQGSRDLLEGKLPGQTMDDTTGQIVTDPRLVKRRITQTVLARFLVLFGFSEYSGEIPIGITLNRGAFANYIRGRSQWIDEMLSLSNEFLWAAQDLDPQIGGDAKLLTQGQTDTLLNALVNIPAPRDSSLRSQYEKLRLLLRKAADNPRYRILICTG